MRKRHVVPLALACGLAAAVAARPAGATSVVQYPPASSPGKIQPAPKGPFRTLKVCRTKTAKGCYATIQKAVSAARAGDTIRVPDGTYKEAVLIRGASKRYLKLVGNVTHPEKVVLEGSGTRQNGVFVDEADNVTISGIEAHDYGANGFFFRSVVNYTMSHVVASLTGKYGLYAFNSIGGRISDSVGRYANDAGLYIGQTPPQTKPVRTTVTGFDGYANVLGVSAENMRYVTITKSRLYNNAIGIAYSAQDGEKYPPATDNTLIGNEIFWNNFNYYKGAPFPVDKDTPVPYPPGLGVVLLGGQKITVEDNDIYGNYVSGVASMTSPLTPKHPGAEKLVGNVVRNNRFGLGGADLNGRDLIGDMAGSSTCWGPNTGVLTTFPADPALFPACPFTGANTTSPEYGNQLVTWLLAPDHESVYIRHPHKAKAGYTPLETWKKGTKTT